MIQLLDVIQKQLNLKLPFVCYLKPNSFDWNLIVQHTDELVTFNGQKGFVFFPFEKGNKIVIPFKKDCFSSGSLAFSEPTILRKATHEFSNTEKEAFEKLVAKGIENIENGVFQKVVISRKIALKEFISEIATFKNLIFAYPNAFRYLFFHPKVGLWMGATPEQLIQINDNHFETVALAGTQLYSENITWSKKEVEEQQIVTDFIVQSIEGKVKHFEVSESNTVQAGNLAHIKSIISGELTNDYTPSEIVEDLHPTPAVCGLPKEESKAFILSNERYDRAYYTGFLGEWNMNKNTDLFVNLRCLQVEAHAVNIYVGCGITKDSNPEKEFFETENKSFTMRTILVNKKV